MYIKILVADKVLTNEEWPTFNSSESIPSLYKIEDGASKLFYGTSLYMWLDKNSTNRLLATIEEPKPTEPAPNPQFSESFLLKLVAVSNNSNLIKDLNV